jgi:hypothetical protein
MLITFGMRLERLVLDFGKVAELSGPYDIHIAVDPVQAASQDKK